MRVQEARASPENPRIQTVIRADPRKAGVPSYILSIPSSLFSSTAPLAKAQRILI
jgi:hypothetical protein